VSEAESLIAPLRSIATPIKQNISSVPENKLVYTASFGSEANPTIACSGKGVVCSVFGGALKTYDKATYVSFIQAFEDLVTTNTDLQGSVFFIEHFSTVKVQESRTIRLRTLSATSLPTCTYPVLSLSSLVVHLILFPLDCLSLSQLGHLTRA
jgi:hypothetical protein